MKRLFALLALLLALGVSTPAMAREWLRAETPHFVVYSDGYPLELDRWARKVEMFDALLRLQFGQPDGRDGTRLTIYMLEDEKAVARLAGQQYMTGLYKRAREGSFAVTNRRPGYYETTLSGQATLFHEYAHHFMYRHFPAAYPAWYREGFAEFAATAEYDPDGTWQFGRPAAYRMRFLRKDPMPIETILFGNAEALPAKRRAAYYAWAWLLVHRLRTDPARAGQLDAYLARFAGGADAREAARTFGDLARLEDELRAYADVVEQYRAPKVTVTFADPVPVETLSPLESRIVDLRLNRLMERDPEGTRAALRDLAGAYPHNGDVQLELALAERDIALRDNAADLSAAEAAADHALAAEPDNARANTLKAELTVRRLASTRDGSRDEWIAARRRLLAAMKTTPDDPLPALVLFESFVKQQAKPPQWAHAAIERAFAMEPENISVRTAYVASLTLRRRFAEAEAAARVLAYDPHAGELGGQALALVERARNASTREADRMAPAGPK